MVILLVAASPVWAKKNPPHTLMLPLVVLPNGAQVPAGTYELTCESQGSAVRVTLWKDGQFVATAPGDWVKNGIKYAEDQALVRVNSEGSKSLIEIRIAGTARSIVFHRTDEKIQYHAMQR
jgi:hypothetical protein